MRDTFNAMYNCKNPYQGKNKKVLCVCSAGLLRSPTIAWVLSIPPYNYNTRSCGINDEYALISLDEVLVEWADEIVTVNPEYKARIEKNFSVRGKIIALDIPDIYEYKSPELIELIKEQYNERSNL